VNLRGALKIEAGIRGDQGQHVVPLLAAVKQGIVNLFALMQYPSKRENLSSDTQIQIMFHVIKNRLATKRHQPIISA
jgi:hypothetical protein